MESVCSVTPSGQFAFVTDPFNFFLYVPDFISAMIVDEYALLCVCACVCEKIERIQVLSVTLLNSY